MRVLRDHVAPLTAALVAGLVLIQPLAANFDKALLGTGDVTWAVASLWHWREAILGQDNWFFTDRLYYPHGASYLTNSLGPLSGVIALPFWPLGLTVAHNATLLIGFALTGYCMYLLVRDLGLSRPLAWFAGLMYMLAPIHLVAVAGHLNKVFIGMIPLALLSCRRGLRPEYPRYWSWITGGMLLRAFFQSPEQMVFAGLGCAIMVVAGLLEARRTASGALLRRAVWTSLASLLAVGVMVVLTVSSVRSLGIAADVRLEALQHQPDLVQFLVPYATGIPPLRDAASQWLAPYVRAQIETAVFLSWTGLLLCLLAFIWVRKEAWLWLTMLAVSVLLSIGPVLRILGQERFTSFDLPIMMPYALFAELPVIGYMRTPTRFMLLGYAAFAVVAALGLEQLRRRLPVGYRGWVVAGAALLLLVEQWPAPYPIQKIQPVPAFYQQLAADPEMYGVLDLPIRPDQENHFLGWHVLVSSYHQLDQITHGKGIASGYVARLAKYHPVFAHFISENAQYGSPLQQDVRVDGEPSSRYTNLRYYLAQNNYRYVVVHKPQPDHPVYQPGMWGEPTARMLVEEVFGAQPPLVDDELTTVYAVDPVPPVTELETSIALFEPAAGQGWTEHRWGESPAAFLVHSPKARLAQLDVTLRRIPRKDRDGEHDYAVLQVDSGNGAVSSRTAIAPLETASVPVALAPGSQTITLTVAPAGDDEDAGPILNFEIDTIDLRTTPAADFAHPTGSTVPEDIQAAYGPGWYDPEQSGDGASIWRWAASPAVLWVYSRDGGDVQLAATPTALHVFDTPDGKGSTGELAVAVGDAAPVTAPVTVGQPFAVTVSLQPGWSRVELALGAGNFRPVDYQPETGDARPLSFALEGLTIHE